MAGVERSLKAAKSGPTALPTSPILWHAPHDFLNNSRPRTESPADVTAATYLCTTAARSGSIDAASALVAISRSFESRRLSRRCVFVASISDAEIFFAVTAAISRSTQAPRIRQALIARRFCSSENVGQR